MQVDITAIESARQRISEHAHMTPILTCASLNEISGLDIFLKAENLQKGGAFKYRGATNAVMQIEDPRNAVCTHSSGNHAIALALAAKKRGICAHIVMPNTSSQIKVESVASTGASIHKCGPTLADRESMLQQVVSETSATFVHPYDNPHVIAGQGTVMLELLDQVSRLDAVFVPVGGGGLLSGTSIVGKHHNVPVYGVEPMLADDAFESLRLNVRQPQPPIRTVAEGLRTSLSDRTFELIRANSAGIIRVSDSEILRAMSLLLTRVKTVVEPSGACALAAALFHDVVPKGSRVGVVLSGGNVDVEPLMRSFGQ